MKIRPGERTEKLTEGVSPRSLEMRRDAPARRLGSKGHWPLVGIERGDAPLTLYVCFAVLGY